MPANNEEHTRLLEEMVEQMKAHILSQDARILEQEQTIADLRSLVDDLRLLKAGLEETLEEFKRQLFGTKSEKTKTSQADAAAGIFQRHSWMDFPASYSATGTAAITR